MEFIVEPGFEIPPKKRSAVTDFIYPFKLMTIGGSFFIPINPDEFKKRPGEKTSVADYIDDKVRRKARQYRERVDKDFYVLTRTRNMIDHNEVGIRVWRIKYPRGSNAD